LFLLRVYTQNIKYIIYLSSDNFNFLFAQFFFIILIHFYHFWFIFLFLSRFEAPKLKKLLIFRMK